MTSAVAVAVSLNPIPLGGSEIAREPRSDREAGAGPPDGAPYAGKRHRISRAVSGVESH